MLAFNGCVEMDGAIAEEAGVWLLPAPLSAIETSVPFSCVNLREPEYATAEDGVKVTKPVRLCPGFNVTGKVCPE